MKSKLPLTLARIEEFANDLLAQHSTSTAPVDVERIANKLGVTVHSEPLEDEVSGMLVIKNGEKHIIVNRGHHANRRRFTIAHELGHLALHHKEGDKVYVDTKLMVYHRSGRSQEYIHPYATTSPHEEREANYFASVLLMPREIVEDFIDKQGIDMFDEVDITRLAQAFEVSEQAISIRLNNLKLIQPVY